ncbi:MAG: helix-turn-helix transcriptional regulator [Pseudomonadota bacterium]
MSLLEERIFEARRDAGIKASNLARHVGVTSAAVSRWEKGQVKNLRMEHLFSIAKLLDVDPEWLATGRGHKKRHRTQQQRDVEDKNRFDQLDQEEQLLVNIYRRLSQASRASLKQALTEWFDQATQGKKST